MFAAAGAAPAAALVNCAAGNGGDFTLDASTPCLLNEGGQNAGTVTVTSDAHAGGKWGGSFATVIGGDSTTSSTTINTVYIPAATAITSANGSYFILNGEYKSTSTSTNLATITSITNDGSVTGVQVVVYNDHHGVIGTLTNNGTLNGSIGSIFNAGGRFDTIINNNTMGAVTNGYTLQGTPFDGSIGSISNTANGTLSAFTNGTAGSVVDSFLNAGTVSGAVSNSGTITSLTNSGSMKSLSNSKAIGSFTNLATGSFSSGITNSATGTITDFSNAGTLKALTNAGTITTLTNTGSFTGTVSNTGTIETLVNAQGGGSTAGVSYSGRLPTNYAIVVSTPTSYGVLTATSLSLSMTFSIDPSSALTLGTRYQNVLSGVSSVNFTGGVTSGTFGGSPWQLVADDAGLANVWDLVYGSLGPDPVNTTAALQANADALRGVMDRRLTSLALTTDYDCASFDAYGICLSFKARYTGMEANNEGAGVLTAAYRVTDQVRVGAFIDYRVSEKDPTGLRFSNDLPTFGAFAGYRQNPNGAGLQGKVVAAFDKGDATITRSDALARTEPGVGKGSLKAYILAGELGWGIALSPSTVATPYIGFRYAQASRGDYVESLTDTVTAPISYNAFVQRQATVTAGVRVGGMLSERVGYQVGAGLEQDLASKLSFYSGSSSISGIEAFALAVSGSGHRTRPVASASAFYQIDNIQRLTTSVSARGQAYNPQAAISVLAGYQVAF